MTTKTTDKWPHNVITADEALTAQMFLQIHGNSSDGFYKDVCKISRALLHAYHDQRGCRE